MRSRRSLAALLQVLLVLVASLLAIVTNYATEAPNAPYPLEALRTLAVPAVAVLVVVLLVGNVAAFYLSSQQRPRRLWDPRRIPYPGLDAFTESETAVFFGRDPEIAVVVRRLNRLSAQPADRFVAVVGASGSGKSSLVNAGVVPRLRGMRWTVLPRMIPGANPIGSLAASLADLDSAWDPAVIARRLRRNPKMLSVLLREARHRGGRFRRALLIIDQMEELITLAGDRERQVFLETVAEALRRDAYFWVLATVRVEFLRGFLESGSAQLFQTPIAIGMMDRSGLAQAIEQPAVLVDMTFAAGLVETILDDVGTSDALPLLAYALQELYFDVGTGGTVAERHYRRLGGVGGALSRQADQVVGELRQTEQMTSVLSVLLKFVAVDGQDATRRRVRLDELTQNERRIVDAFIDARLLVSDSDNGEAVAHVAHEALFRQWPPLRQEVEAHAEQLRQRAELERWAADWERSQRSDDYLLTGQRLTLAQQWLEALDASGQASQSALAFVDASRHRDRAFLSRVSDAIGRHVLANVELYPEFSILLSLAALEECAATALAKRALLTALAFSHARAVLTGHHGTVRNLAWSPDGARIATASRDGTARIWDADAGRMLVELTGHQSMVEMVAWSPDSARVATASRDGTARIWDADGGHTVRILTGARDIVRAVAWSPDGRLVAAASRDLLVRLWDAGTGEAVSALAGHEENILGVAFSPDGTRLATASHDRTVRIWYLEAESTEHVLTGHTDIVEGVAWSPDGRRLATASGDHTIRVWDTANGSQQLLIRGHGDQVWNVAWSPDGQQIASVSTDKSVRIFNASDAEPIAVLRGHGDTVWGVCWSPDGSRLASASEDQTARIWDVRPLGAELLAVNGHSARVNDARWSPDGRYLASVSDDRTVRWWDATTAQPVAVAGPQSGGHTERVWTAAWSPDGSLLATGSDDCTIRLWRGHREFGRLNHNDSAVEAVAWSSDGGRLATGAHDAIIRLWDVRDRREICTLSGHQDWVISLAWSPSSRFIASTSDDRTGRIWDIEAGEPYCILHGHENWVDEVSWSPDEQYVATGSADWTARVWEVSTGRQVRVLRGHEGRVRSVAWSPNGRRIATASDDRTVRVWDAYSGEPIDVVGVHRDKVSSLMWSDDGGRLLTASFDGTIRVWASAPDFDAVRAAARSRVFRGLTQDERRSHLLPAST